MSVLAQYGYGMNKMIEPAIVGNDIEGVIFGARDIGPEKLVKLVRRLRKKYNGSHMLLFDPQFYAFRMGTKRRNLDEYGYAPDSSITPTTLTDVSIGQLSQKIITYQSRMDVDRYISPAIMMADFKDAWSACNIKIAQSSINHNDQLQKKKPILMSIVFDEQALKNKAALDDYLNKVTLLNISGFYTIMNPSPGDSTYPARCNADSLANYMYAVYVLSKLNGFEVVCGYSDFVGIILHAVGASAIASGSTSKLRQFDPVRFIETESKGSRRPRPRYTSLPLMSSIRVEGELEAVIRIGELPSVLSKTPYDPTVQANPMGKAWDQRIQFLHHWAVLSKLAAKACSGKDVGANLAAVETMIKNATATYDKLYKNKMVSLNEPSSRQNLAVWQDAITQFKRKIGI